MFGKPKYVLPVFTKSTERNSTMPEKNHKQIAEEFVKKSTEYAMEFSKLSERLGPDFVKELEEIDPELQFSEIRKSVEKLAEEISNEVTPENKNDAFRAAYIYLAHKFIFLHLDDT